MSEPGDQGLVFEGQTLHYSQDDEKRHWLRGCVAMVDHRGKNKRVYPRTTMESAVASYIQEKVEQGAAFCELDHPQSATVSLQDACVRITRLWFEGAELHAEMLILDTTQGRNLMALLDRGGRVGASTRARGEQNGKTGEVSNLSIEAIDIVSNPANTGGKLMDHFYEDEEEPAKTLQATLSGMKLRRRKSQTNTRPQLADTSDQQHQSPASQTTHPSKRGRQNMKQEAAMRLAKGSRYLDPKDGNKGDSSSTNPYRPKNKPKFLKPSKSRVQLEAELVESLLQQVTDHHADGPVFEAAMALGESYLHECSGVGPVPKPKSMVIRAKTQNNLKTSNTEPLGAGAIKAAKKAHVAGANAHDALKREAVEAAVWNRAYGGGGGSAHNKKGNKNNV